MSERTLPRRLRVGLASTGVLVFACLLGPLLLPRPPGNDPARAGLLPPGTLTTVVRLADGTVMVSRRVDVAGNQVTVFGPGTRETTIPRAAITSVSTHRFWLGSDRFGRDLLVECLAGGRISLAVASLSLLVALVFGLGVGLVAATGGRLVDAILMRLVDAFLAFPILFLLILCVTLFRPGPSLLVPILGFSSWMGLARLVRGQVLSLRQRPFILAARTAGSPWYRIWGWHYIPSLAGPVSQDAALRMGDLVLAEATLSYLGLGIPPSTPTWGSLVAQGHQVLSDAWWLATFPGLAIAALIISLALVGDGLQEMVRGDS